MPDLSTYETVVTANLDQMTHGASAKQVTAIRTCFDAKIATAVTPEEIATVNDDAAGESMSKVVLVVNKTARACLAEAGL